jgi:hypothetical protein
LYLPYQIDDTATVLTAPGVCDETREPSPSRVEPLSLYVMVCGRKRLATVRHPF